MTVRVLKYAFTSEPQLVIPFCIDSKVLHVADQTGVSTYPTMWVEQPDLWPGVEETFRTFICYPTGFLEIDEQTMRHVGSAVMLGGHLVWHVYGKQVLEDRDNKVARYLW